MEREDTGRRLPLFSSLGGYDRAWLRGDLVAGLTVWAVLVPEALAYASIAGVSPVVGLYAAPAALLLYDLQRQDVRLVMARDIGQVRDVLRRTEGERLPLSAYPSARRRSRRSPVGPSRGRRTASWSP
jgi:Sulfate permease family